MRSDRTVKHARQSPFNVSMASMRTLVIAGVAAVAVLAIVIFAVVRCSSGQQDGHSAVVLGEASTAAVNDASKSGEDSASADVPIEPTPGVNMPLTTDAYALNPADLLSIPGSDAPITINLSPSAQPAELSAEQLQPVNDALSSIHENGSCGFVFLDVSTGHGIAFNADEAMYIASASKAMLAYYAIREGDTWDGNIESAISDSNNDAYEAFGYQYFTGDYIDWLGNHDIEHDAWSGDLYPKTSARGLASIWAEILQFLQEDSDESRWFAGLLSETNQSYIRDALEDRGAEVMNKAGWIADDEFDSITDAGIIQMGGYTYLMVIETSQPAWGGGEEAVSDLAAALFNLRFVM